MDIKKINEILDNEIKYAKGCNMPQFVMGLQQAKKALNEYKSQKCSACGGSGHYKNDLCSCCNGTGIQQ